MNMPLVGILSVQGGYHIRGVKFNILFGPNLIIFLNSALNCDTISIKNFVIVPQIPHLARPHTMPLKIKNGRNANFLPFSKHQWALDFFA
jgi:hypothetical protein